MGFTLSPKRISGTVLSAVQAVLFEARYWHAIPSARVRVRAIWYIVHGAINLKAHTTSSLDKHEGMLVTSSCFSWKTDYSLVPNLK